MDNNKRLYNQTALVTGGNTGIGSAIAKAMALAGANVAINYIADETAAQNIEEGIRRNGGSAITVKADVSREDRVRRMFESVLEAYGSLEILVNNAGIQRDSGFLEMTLEQWQKVLDVNLTGAFLCSREASKVFCRQGVVPEKSKAAGKILFVGSVHEIIPWAEHANYAVSKGGVLLLMKSLAQELAPHKIRVNSISPGAIKTDINREAWESPEAESRLLKLIPYDRLGVTEDVASAAVWMASDEADYITGSSIYVDGGMLLYPGFRTGG